VPGPLAIVAVTVAPALTVVALTVTVVVVMDALVASRVVESFRKKRTL